MVDYTNLQCIDNYTYDSGWKYTPNGLLNLFDGVKFSSDNNTYFFFNTNNVGFCFGICDTFAVGNLTYYKGGIQGTTYGISKYQIKMIENLINYKAFSSF